MGSSNRVSLGIELQRLFGALTITLLIGLLFVPNPLKGQKAEREVTLESAELVISGKTNISDFSCQLIKSNLDERLTHEADINDGVDLFKGMELRFKVSDFACDKMLMSSDLQTLLKEEEFPFITMHINDVIVDKNLNQNGIREISASITLHIAGCSKQEYIQNAQIEQTDQWVLLSGSHSVLMTTFMIEPPTKLFGAVHTEDSIEILFSIKLK